MPKAPKADSTKAKGPYKGPKPKKAEFDNAPSVDINEKRRKGKKAPSGEKSELDELRADAPRAFRNLLKRQESAKKREAEAIEAKSNPQPTKPQPAPKEELKIRKGESMSDFSRRVNEAVPLPQAKGVGSAKAEKTRQKQRAKAENLRAEYKSRLDKRRGRTADDDKADLDAENWKWSNRDKSPDPWDRIQTTEKPKFGEVADRPPELPKLKIRGNVPKAAASSAARREILEAERENVIAEYRRLKAARENTEN